MPWRDGGRVSVNTFVRSRYSWFRHSEDLKVGASIVAVIYRSPTKKNVDALNTLLAEHKVKCGLEFFFLKYVSSLVIQEILL